MFGKRKSNNDAYGDTLILQGIQLTLESIKGTDYDASISDMRSFIKDKWTQKHPEILKDYYLALEENWGYGDQFNMNGIRTTFRLSYSLAEVVNKLFKDFHEQPKLLVQKLNSIILK